jgi:hypothetical protein
LPGIRSTRKSVNDGAHMNLTSGEDHFLSLIVDGGSISIGSSTGARLHCKGLVELVRNGRRFGITRKGKAALRRITLALR